jgi:hypothetical protein
VYETGSSYFGARVFSAVSTTNNQVQRAWNSHRIQIVKAQNFCEYYFFALPYSTKIVQYGDQLSLH